MRTEMTERQSRGSPPTEPRTVAGRAWLSGMRPHHRRAATPLVASIETEAARPALAALLEADAVLADVATIDLELIDREAVRAIIQRARLAHEHAADVLEPTT
jgi:hypothetical protein